MAIYIRAATVGTDLARHQSLLRRVLDVPVVCISLVDSDGWLTTSSHGLPPPNPMLIAWVFLKRTKSSGHPLVVEDARVDPRFMMMPMVHDGTVAAYLGMKLVTPGGCVVGTLSAMDQKPRRWTARDLDFTRKVGSRIVAEREAAGAQLPEAGRSLLPGLPPGRGFPARERGLRAHERGGTRSTEGTNGQLELGKGAP